jgi:hypothetical protein
MGVDGFREIFREYEDVSFRIGLIVRRRRLLFILGLIRQLCVGEEKFNDYSRF